MKPRKPLDFEYLHPKQISDSVGDVQLAAYIWQAFQPCLHNMRNSLLGPLYRYLKRP